jgi:hypothetical protein
MTAAGLQLVFTEGSLDASAAIRTASEVGIEILGPVSDSGGNAGFWERASKYNQAAKHIGYILGLGDLEGIRCVGPVLQEKLPMKHANLLVRLAVPELESWLIADGTAMARFLRVSPARMPSNPDSLPDPKRTLVNLARSSTSTRISGGMVPRTGISAMVGPEYQALMTEFIEDVWSPRRASKHSDSLARALIVLRNAAAHPARLG